MGNWLKNLLRLIVILPLAVIFLSFDMANRQKVVISFDPFNSGDAILPQVELPLFVVLLGALVLGAVLGALATWFGQRHYRRVARDVKSATETLRADNESLRNKVATLKSASNSTAVTTRNAA